MNTHAAITAKTTAAKQFAAATNHGSEVISDIPTWRQPVRKIAFGLRLLRGRLRMLAPFHARKKSIPRSLALLLDPVAAAAWPQCRPNTGLTLPQKLARRLALLSDPRAATLPPLPRFGLVHAADATTRSSAQSTPADPAAPAHSPIL